MPYKKNIKKQPELVMKFHRNDEAIALRFTLIKHSSEDLTLLDEDGFSIWDLKKTIEEVNQFGYDLEKRLDYGYDFSSFYFRNSSGEDCTSKILPQINLVKPNFETVKAVFDLLNNRKKTEEFVSKISDNERWVLYNHQLLEHYDLLP